jgi:hypothetical protein
LEHERLRNAQQWANSKRITTAERHYRPPLLVFGPPGLPIDNDQAEHVIYVQEEESHHKDNNNNKINLQPCSCSTPLGWILFIPLKWKNG